MIHTLASAFLALRKNQPLDPADLAKLQFRLLSLLQEQMNQVPMADSILDKPEKLEQWLSVAEPLVESLLEAVERIDRQRP